MYVQIYNEVIKFIFLKNFRRQGSEEDKVISTAS